MAAIFRMTAFLVLLATTTTAQMVSTAPGWLPETYRYDVPYFEPTTYDPNVPTIEQLLGCAVAERPARHADVERCLKAWANSPRLSLHAYGQTHERRTLYYAIVTSPENQEHIAQLQADLGKLADPRRLKNDAEADELIAKLPAVAWLAYTIHGDELSGTDAALAVLYHLVAGQSAEVKDLLRETIVIIDPVMNPDGRDRFIQQTDEFRGYVPSLDQAGAVHDGRWPAGRGNHYYFDLNRDWIVATQPETRGRRQAIVQWSPHLLVDGHEMGENDTFLFNPPRAPFNPALPLSVRKWWHTLADEQAAAFDRHEWSYYTREWLEFWYPGYTDGFAAYLGSIAILYEQARTGGSPILQETGDILTYREAVHHQVVSTMANLASLQKHRTAILRDFVAQRRAAIAAEGQTYKYFLLPPSANRSRKALFVRNLLDQGIEVSVTQEAATARDVVGGLRTHDDARDFPAGTVVIARGQPHEPLVSVLLDFDPRMDPGFLQEEREQLEKHGRSRLYDTTAWSLPLVFGLEAYWAADVPGLKATPYEPPQETTGRVIGGGRQTYGYVIDNADDRWCRATAEILQYGLVARVADKPFRAAAQSFGRGSLLLRTHENGEDLERKLRQIATDVGVDVYALETARSTDDSPDLGGGEFTLLHKPKVALALGEGLDANDAGTIWHLLDHETHVAVSVLSPARLRGADLRYYNVIILPGAWGDVYGGLQEPLLNWVRDGGTLILVEGAAAHFADGNSGFSRVRRRDDVIGELAEFEYAAALRRYRGSVPVDPTKVWDAPQEQLPSTQPSGLPSRETLEKLEAWRRKFMPRGAIVRGYVDEEHWLGYGLPPTVSLFYSGGQVLLAPEGVATAVRLAEAKDLRLSGLLWPEAATRMGDAAFATTERVGRGQVVLLAQLPDFRAFWYGTRRLLQNAVLLGPGCGASPAP